MKLSSSFGSRRHSSTITAVILAALLLCQPGFLLVAAQSKKPREKAAPAAEDAPEVALAPALLPGGAGLVASGHF